jgi:RimJ/RimL family protein N-acetyltransferase
LLTPGTRYRTSPVRVLQVSNHGVVQTIGLKPVKGLVFRHSVAYNRMPFTKIVTERLALRPLAASDAQKIFEYRSRPEVSRYQSWGIESRDEIQSQIESLALTEPGLPGAWYQIGIVLQFSSELIGDCGFHVLETEPRQVEFGISLAPKYQCHGYAAEALRALLNYLFVDLSKHRVFVSVDPRNLRSIKLMQRVGMRNEAHFIRSLWFKGDWVDDMIFAMLASDWRAGALAVE